MVSYGCDLNCCSIEAGPRFLPRSCDDIRPETQLSSLDASELWEQRNESTTRKSSFRHLPLGARILGGLFFEANIEIDFLAAVLGFIACDRPTHGKLRFDVRADLGKIQDTFVEINGQVAACYLTVLSLDVHVHLDQPVGILPPHFIGDVHNGGIP